MRGLPPGTIPDTWNLTHPERVEAVARAYVEAGSQVILTNTFRANAIAMHGSTEDDLDAINRAGVALSRHAAVEALVFASIGPTGKMLLSGEIDSEQVTAAFAAQARSLAAAGVLTNVASVLLTIALARLLAPHSYGVLNQLTGLYLILSMPGSAVVVAVVRRVTIWHEDGSGHLVRRWAGRVHRQGALLVLVWAAVVFAGRHDVAIVLNERSGIGIAAIVTAAAFFVLLSLDRGLLQANRSYRPLLVLAGFGPSGAAVGVLIGEVVAAVHARWAAVRAWSSDGRVPRRWATGSWRAALGRDPVLDGAVAERRTVVLDLVLASISLSMIAVLQNIDVLVVGRDDPGHSGAYAAVSVTSKAIVFGALVLGGYLLPEAAIRWRQGGHALRQLAVVLMLLAAPSALLLGIAVAAPQLLLELVFHHDYTSAADALAPLVVAMIMLSLSVVLTMYLLAVGRRWVVAVLIAGGAALTLAVLTVHGSPRATALVDLVIQAAVLVVIAVGFLLVHRPRLQGGMSRRRTDLLPVT